MRCDHLPDSATKAYVGQIGGHALDIASRTTRHRVPGGPTGDLQQSVIGAKAGEAVPGVIKHRGRRAGPDRTGHRQQVPVTKRLAIATLRKKFAEGCGRRVSAAGIAIKSQDIAQHAEKCRTHQIAPLRKETRQVTAAPFDILIHQSNAERHVTAGASDTQMVKQGNQIRIGGPVEDQKSGIHGQCLARHTDIDRMGVSTQSMGRLEQGDLVRAREQPGAGQTADARTDNRHLHTFVLDKLFKLT